MTPGDRRLGAIVFTDIVGYSALVHRDEALGRRLLDRQREVVRRIVPQHGGREIETAGDSFLLEFDSALAAVQAVVAIQQELARQQGPDRVVLRASVHLGDIEHRGREVFGDGVNIAARLLPLSPEGGLALSAPVLAMVRQRLPLPARAIGTPELKNIATPVEVLVVEPAGVAAVPVASPAWAPARQRSGRAPGRRTWAVALSVAALLSAMGAGYLALRSPPAAALDKSVAVLPFTNLSEDKANAYFADGMQDEILTNLSRIRDLKVISRTSVERYRGQAHDLRSIARELDVATVLEGSVQRAGDRVRITVQLIDASNDAHLWAERYDREVEDVFAVQSEVARRIAEALRASLLPEEAQAIAAVPTQDPGAYDLYLRALTLTRPLWVAHRWDEHDVPLAQSLLEQAVAADPGFALGWAQLAMLGMGQYWFGPLTYRTPERLERAHAAAARALALKPGLGEAHYAMALYHYWGRFDYDRALDEIEQARAALPGLADIPGIVGAIYRRQGRFEEALAELERAAVLDPKRPGAWMDLGGTQLALGDLEASRASHDRAVATSEDPEVLRVRIAEFRTQATGDLQEWRRAIDSLPPGSPARARVADSEFTLHMFAHEFDRAEQVLARMAGTWMEREQTATPVAQLHAWLAWARGDRAAAREALSRSRMLLEPAVAAGNVAVLGDLAVAYAGLGLREQALAAGRRFVELRARDAWSGPYAIKNLAMIHLVLGERDEALAQLERYRQKNVCRVCRGEFLDPVWDPLRDDPRFRALLDPAPPA
jgi:TolB-like protein/class 3 adenylate cyclase/Flp pilus assembly protein TadD